MHYASLIINQSRYRKFESRIGDVYEFQLPRYLQTIVGYWSLCVEAAQGALFSSEDADIKVIPCCAAIYDGLNPTETDANVKRAWVSARSDQPIDNSMHNTLSQTELKIDNDIDDVIMTVARGEFRGLIAEGAD